MKILLTGGGSAGHVMVHLALMPEFRKHFSKIYYIGTKGIEKNIIKQYSFIEYYEIETPKLIRGINYKNLFIPFKLISAIKKCKEILSKIRPNIIFSKGGYVSIPVVMAAKSLNIPVILHECDKTIGLANKICLPFSKYLCTSFKNTKPSKKNIYTGLPIRDVLYNGSKTNVYKQANFSQHKTNLLFMGGSLGAKTINDIVYSCIDVLCKNYNVVHIVGKNNIKNIDIPNYLQIEYTDRIEDYFAFADIIICRSGANTIFELLALNKPMILIPLSKSASRGEQIKNAEHFRNLGYSELIYEEYLSNNILLNQIKKVEKNKKIYIETMQNNYNKNANKRVLEVILNNINK